MILLVVGLVAVIVVVLIAVFLSIRLGRGDEDDEADLRPSRDRRHDQEERWQERDARRVPAPAGRGAARNGRAEAPGYSSRGPARDRAPHGRDADGPPRRPAREAAASRRTAPARSAVGAQARGRYDAGPPRRPAAEDDYASADYPSMDFGPPAGHLSGDHPSVEFPVPDYEAANDRRDRQEARRKAAPAPAANKTRSRQRGKRDDDGDWPSSEWDKLSDEQYWAELSADKPLATMARPSRPAGDAAAAPANGAAKAKPAPRDARAPRPDRDAPSRKEPGRRERGDQREPLTERLPVRAARQGASLPPAPPREPDASASGRSYPEPRPALDSGPRPSRDTGPHPARATGSQAARDTGPRPRPDHRRRDTTGPQPARERDLAMLSGLAGAPPPIPGALDDDPLTSPSFSLKAVPATDSRSYSNARKHAKTTGSPAPEPPTANGTEGNLAAGYSDPGHAYHAAAPAADWYSAPPAEAQTPAYGNPYAYTGQANGSSLTGYTDAQAPDAYANYQADPLRVYSPPGYEAPVPYAEPAPPAAYPAMPAAGMAAPPPAAGPMPYPDGYPAQPYPEQPGYPDGYSAGYAPGYEGGYTGDPYAAGGYGPYPPQG
jgi:hypothetical protein